MLIARIAALRVQLVCGALALALAASVVGVGIGGGSGGPTSATDDVEAANADTETRPWWHGPWWWPRW